MPTQYPDLFAALAHPFEPYEIKERPGGNGRTLHYITARTAANRLDSVLGPENWSDRFYEVCNCLFCEITITLPDGSKVSKADAGGFKDMTEKVGGQNVIDQENTDKTGATDAFKRAAAKFGIARYLYRDGVPSYDGHPAPPPAQSNGQAPTRSHAPDAQRAPFSVGGVSSAPGVWRGDGGEVKDRPGTPRGVLAWMNEVESALEMPLKNKVFEWMKSQGMALQGAGRNDEQNQAAVEFIRGLVNGRMADPNQDAENHTQEPRQAPTKPHQQPPATGPFNIDESDQLKSEKRRIVTNVKAVVRAGGDEVNTKNCLERIEFYAWQDCGNKTVGNLRECSDAMLIRDLDKVMAQEADRVTDEVPF